ncbi:hypothetical protein CROQUDRAFT_717275 [Cronartium quercuum f. sp. fusiforme G11]|uniref:Uncharacterized protein n=1 Tax=Cronartium quercuum f. sp. fusiforme G11 TaxID=708437 RepID=A0A9P6NAZ6_9BASI|nr:hypothetical protein CROQUDRAFT_717275 [Cronartium quercuum f. sp. fusiforme G11]
MLHSKFPCNEDMLAVIHGQISQPFLQILCLVCGLQHHFCLCITHCQALGVLILKMQLRVSSEKEKTGITEQSQGVLLGPSNASANSNGRTTNPPDTSDCQQVNIDYIFYKELAMMRTGAHKWNMIRGNAHVYKSLPKFPLMVKIDIYHDPWHIFKISLFQKCVEHAGVLGEPGNSLMTILKDAGSKSLVTVKGIINWSLEMKKGDNFFISSNEDSDELHLASMTKPSEMIRLVITHQDPEETKKHDENVWACKEMHSPTKQAQGASVSVPQSPGGPDAEDKWCHHGCNPSNMTLVKNTSQPGAVAPVNNFYYYSLPPSSFPMVPGFLPSTMASPSSIGAPAAGTVPCLGTVIPPHVSVTANTHPPPLSPPLPGPLPPFEAYLLFSGIKEDQPENYNPPTLARLGCPYQEAVALCGKAAKYTAYLQSYDL